MDTDNSVCKIDTVVDGKTDITLVTDLSQQCSVTEDDKMEEMTDIVKESTHDDSQEDEDVDIEQDEQEDSEYLKNV